MPLEAGTKLGPYEVAEAIGAGGMGEVYRARDTKLNRDVALKVLPEALVSEPERLARFQREAEVLASLNHPNIAHIYGLEDSGDTTAIVLELVEGLTLAERIAQGPIPLDEALDIARQIADALEAAHAIGIIHRDLKPANIKITHEGVAKVLDFGLAKALMSSDGADAELSQSPTLTKGTAMGTILGTAAYMSPEQAKGKPVDTRTDVWAYGIVLYEMLAGERPFKGEDVSDTLVSVFRDEPDWTKLSDEIPARIHQAMRVCLRKDAKRRVRDIAAVRLAMEGAFETEAAETTEGAPTYENPSRRGAIRQALTALVAVIVGGLAVWMLIPAPERPVGRFVVNTSRAGTFSGGTTAHDIAISPDGMHIVYSAAPNRELYVRSVDQLDGVSALGNLPVSDTPFFSPDGAWVGFATGSDTSWKKVSISGGPPITLWDGPAAPRGASWGPDGTIIFAHSEVGSGLFRGSDAGGEPETLTTADETAGEVFHRWPEFLPGGDAVLFTIVKGRNEQDREIAVLDLETGEQRVLIQGGSSARYASTGHIVYGSEDTLWAVAFDVTRLEVTGEPVPIVEGVMMKASGAANFALSPTGALVYASGTGGGENHSLVWVDRDGNEEPVAAEVRSYQEFSLSPDGTRVALRVFDREDIDVWILNLARNTSTRLTFEPGPELFPLWTPDGARVAFGRGGAPLSWKAADGTGEVETLGERQGQNPQAFTPEGKTVVFEQRGGAGRYDIGMLSLDGERTSTLLLDSEFAERNAALSLDGRWLAYQSNESGRFEVYVRPFPDVSSGRWQISTDGGVWPLWNPAGAELFFRGPSGLMAQSFRADTTFEPLALTELFAWEFAGRQNRRMDVSPDGRRFLLFKDANAVSDDEDEIGVQVILVQNWFEELKERVPN